MGHQPTTQSAKENWKRLSDQKVIRQAIMRDLVLRRRHARKAVADALIAHSHAVQRFTHARENVVQNKEEGLTGRLTALVEKADREVRLAVVRLRTAVDEYKANSIAAQSTASGLETPIPVIEGFSLDGKIMREDEKMEQHGDRVVISGAELLGTTAIAPNSSYSSGSALFKWLLTPFAFQGGRLYQAMQMYDLFKWRRLIIEAIPIVPSSYGGIVIGACEPDVFEDPTVVGLSNVARDLISRPGAVAHQVFEPMCYGISFPQQAEYFTANTDVPNLCVPGVFNQIAGSPLAAGAAAQPLHMLIAHYEIELYSPSDARATLGPLFSLYGSANAINFNSITLTVRQAFFTTLAQVPGAWALVPGLIGVCVVNSSGTSGSNAPLGTGWQTLLAGETEKSVSLTDGCSLWFRLDPTSTNVVFYPSAGAAITGAVAGAVPGASDSYKNSLTTVMAGSGNYLNVEAIQLFQLPESTA